MTKDEAHQILDEQKDGTRLHPIIKITRALWTTGDIGRALPTHSRPFSQDGIDQWLESTRMAQGKGTGTASIGNIQGNQSGIDTNNESTK